MLGQEHMRSLFENATEGIILTGKEGKIILMNPAALKMFQYNVQDIEGQSIEILIPDQYKKSHQHLREGFYHKPENRVMGHNRDLFGKKKDGTGFPVEVSLSHYKKDDQTYVIAFIVDITRRKEIENNLIEQQKKLETVSNEIRKLNADLEVKVEERTLILKEALNNLEQSQTELSDALDKERQLNEIKGRFVSMASHEFRTPLSTILSSASLLGKYAPQQNNEKWEKHIDKIRNSVKHLNDILEDFLSLGKLDEGRVETHPSNFDLKELIEETVEEIKGLFKKGQMAVIKFSGDSVICTDKKLLKNILINLITNASKFSAESQDILIQAMADSSLARIEVADQGIGISDEDQGHLFSSFFRGANAANIAGTGLGLHIVKRYTDLLGGEINLHSELNKGTKISILIPASN
ncbi:MAG: PAS domain-containing sensor histidine kinase [Bacteroidetes bacterium]|nr:MAG: PAS domain-containing sensor histidine kinase [Bacteroidota bacterium]